jgi:transposase
MEKRNTKKCEYCEKNLSYGLQKKLFRLRKKVHCLYFQYGHSKLFISHQLRVSRNFVIKWTKKKHMNFEEDKRGWEKNRGRAWNGSVHKRILALHRSLTANHHYFLGATAIVQEWNRQYAQPAPPLRTVGWILKQLGLTHPNKKRRNKGAARYLCYPEDTIHTYAGKRVLEIDFIGKKFISGRTAPLHFAAASFKYAPKLRYYKPVESETADCLMQFLKTIFETFEIPDVVKMDNGFAMSGTAPQKRVLSKLALWLLEQGIYPMYAVPRKPFSQASIEGNNSVFGRKFWNRFDFKSTAEIAQELIRFNQESLQYYQYQPPAADEGKKIFTKKIFFLRQVREDEKGKAFIDVAHDKITLPKTFINYFVFVEWNLEIELLTVFIEKEKQLKKIKSITFTLNPKSKQKLSQLSGK